MTQVKSLQQQSDEMTGNRGEKDRVNTREQEPKALATIDHHRGLPNIPTIDQVRSIQELARIAAQSGLVKTKSAPDAFFIAMYGLELGIPPMTALRTIYSVNGGVPTCSGEAMLSLLRGSGKVRVTIPDPGIVKDSATVTIHRLDTDEKQSFTFTMKMAEKAGLVKEKGNWSSYPHMMLIWRAVSMGAKLLCSDIIGGLYTVEEIRPDIQVDETGTPVGDMPPKQEDIIEAEYTETPTHPTTPTTATKPESTPEPEAVEVKWHFDRIINQTLFMFKHVKHAENSINKMIDTTVITPDDTDIAAIWKVFEHRCKSDYNYTIPEVCEILTKERIANGSNVPVGDLKQYVKDGGTIEKAWEAVKTYHENANLGPAKPAKADTAETPPPVDENDIPF